MVSALLLLRLSVPGWCAPDHVHTHEKCQPFHSRHQLPQWVHIPNCSEENFGLDGGGGHCIIYVYDGTCHVPATSLLAGFPFSTRPLSHVLLVVGTD